MTRAEFLSLPPSIALSVLLDAFPQLLPGIVAIAKPELPRPPKFDQVIYRKSGVT